MGPKELQDQVQLVDVREPEEWRNGRIPDIRRIHRDEQPGKA